MARVKLIHYTLISIHALREEGDGSPGWLVLRLLISIHALREEGDQAVAGAISPVFEFLSTPSARRATIVSLSFSLMIRISIHALREEGDVGSHAAVVVGLISIHALREEGDVSQLALDSLDGVFLSTPSARRATLVANRGFVDADISIHALREEGDVFS